MTLEPAAQIFLALAPFLASFFATWVFRKGIDYDARCLGFFLSIGILGTWLVFIPEVPFTAVPRIVAAMCTLFGVVVCVIGFCMLYKDTEFAIKGRESHADYLRDKLDELVPNWRELPKTDVRKLLDEAIKAAQSPNPSIWPVAHKDDAVEWLSEQDYETGSLFVSPDLDHIQEGWYYHEDVGLIPITQHEFDLLRGAKKIENPVSVGEVNHCAESTTTDRNLSSGTAVVHSV